MSVRTAVRMVELHDRAALIESAAERRCTAALEVAERMIAMMKPRPCLTAQSPINAISRPAEAAAAVRTRATARVRK